MATVEYNQKGKFHIRLVTNLNSSLHPGDTIRILEGILVIIHVLSHIVLYGDTWKHLIFNFKKKQDIGFPAAVLMNSSGMEDIARNLLYSLLPSSRV